jgi:hypothetical protein
MGVFYRAGFKWERCGEDYGWVTEVTDRIRAMTWPFGRCYQCVVEMDYPKSRDPIDGGSVRIGLEAQPTRDKAMIHGVLWAKRISAEGFQGPEELFADLYRHWPTLNRTRLDVIDHVFFTNGNGYAWLDGCIVSEGPEDHLRYNRKKDLAEKAGHMANFRRIVENHKGEDTPLVQSFRESLNRYGGEGFGPFPDEGKPRNFYPICEYAKICIVPDDVRDDWLAVCYEAALLLRDRSGLDWDSTNPLDQREGEVATQREHGIRIIGELRTRFPGRVPLEG